METIVVYVLSVQLWTDPPPKIEVIYQKEFSTHEECMKERAVWDQKKLVALCLLKNKDVRSISKGR